MCDSSLTYQVPGNECIAILHVQGDKVRHAVSEASSVRALFILPVDPSCSADYTGELGEHQIAQIECARTE